MRLGKTSEGKRKRWEKKVAAVRIKEKRKRKPSPKRRSYWKQHKGEEVGWKHRGTGRIALRKRNKIRLRSTTVESNGLKYMEDVGAHLSVHIRKKFSN